LYYVLFTNVHLTPKALTCLMFSTSGRNRRPERIENKDYDFSADVWSLGLTLLECAVGKYPYEIDGGPLGLMMQICNDATPIPPGSDFPAAFCDFVNLCMRKKTGERPTASALRAHPLVFESVGADAGAFMRRVVDPMKALQAAADTFAAHYYLLVDHPAPSAVTIGALYRGNSCLTDAHGEQAGEFIENKHSTGLNRRKSEIGPFV